MPSFRAFLRLRLRWGRAQPIDLKEGGQYATSIYTSSGTGSPCPLKAVRLQASGFVLLGIIFFRCAGFSLRSFIEFNKHPIGLCLWRWLRGIHHGDLGKDIEVG